MSEPRNYVPSTYSHQEALARYAVQTVNNCRNILEYGCGFGSTPMLHGIVSYNGNDPDGSKLYTFEDDRLWLKKFTHLATPFHIFTHIATWDIVPMPCDIREVGLVLIDQGTGHTRPQYAKWFLEQPNFHGVVICHDLDHIHYTHFKWDDAVFAAYDQHILYDHFRPRTMVLIKD